jgi:hypothetical protein
MNADPKPYDAITEFGVSRSKHGSAKRSKTDIHT